MSPQTDLYEWMLSNKALREQKVDRTLHIISSRGPEVRDQEIATKMKPEEK